jgi:AcrR family transcriptional regulator
MPVEIILTCTVSQLGIGDENDARNGTQSPSTSCIGLRVTPRRYTQRSRAARVEQTRARIVEAAAEDYRERGVAGSALQSIAERADVSRGTILNHFGDAEGLLIAVLETAVASLDLPDARILDGAANFDERARRFAQEMLRFYERSEDWWYVFADDRDQLPANPKFKAEEQRFWEAVGSLQQTALGDLALKPTIVGAMAVLVAPTTIGAMKAVGLEVESAVELAADLFVDAVRRAAQPSQPQG